MTHSYMFIWDDNTAVAMLVPQEWQNDTEVDVTSLELLMQVHEAAAG